MPQLEFKSLGWHRVKGRGWLASVESDKEYDRSHPEIIGERVLIDGEEFLVKAVERFMPLPPIYPGERIGLLVEKCESE